MLKKQLDSYLNDISHLAHATLASHKATLNEFVEECQACNITTEDLNPQLIAEYLADLAAKHNYRPSTVSGKISVLANFNAYVQNIDPELCNAKIRCHLSEISNLPFDATDPVTKHIKLDENSKPVIETYIQRLRKNAYGTREHVVTEITINTGCRSKSLRKINLGDVDLETGELYLLLAKTHAVGKADPNATWKVTLPEEIVRALATYIEHERTPTENDDAEAPLLTTHNGRVSVFTINRSIRNSMCKVLGNGELVGKSNTDYTQADSVNDCHLSVHSLREYYLSQHIEE